jgi:hypothetical protein
MIPRATREALEVLAELCELAPTYRLGQLMGVLGDLGEDRTDRNLGDIDDEQLLDVMYEFRAMMVAHRESHSAEASTAPAAAPQ